ncbi:hypothetical protein EDD85DRAFT_793512 [Armillaria nabsnona]|nr:hypothetical protein EDD85DRAFT_793512 [Armillaria nabsnona]
MALTRLQSVKMAGTSQKFNLQFRNIACLHMSRGYGHGRSVVNGCRGGKSNLPKYTRTATGPSIFHSGDIRSFWHVWRPRVGLESSIYDIATIRPHPAHKR